MRSIRISEPVGAGPRNLRFFAGRSLGEQEFDLMQAYVADRCAALLVGDTPGIVWGLQVLHDGVGANMQFTIQPGLALGADGRAIRVHAPIVMDWPAVVEEFTNRTRAPDAIDAQLNGWYYLTIKRGTMLIDPPSNAKPCTRTELDILRDSRLETLATLDLQLVSAAPSLQRMPTSRAINQISARALSEQIFNSDTGAVPVALVRLSEGDVATEDDAPIVDSVAGRYITADYSAHLAFLNRWTADVESMTGGRFSNFLNLFGAGISFDPERSLGDQLGIDFLPAAGPFPEGLIQRIAGRPDGEGWSNPIMRFNPLDLQIDIAPLRVSQIDETIARELPRGVVDLVNNQGDRIRVFVAIPDADFSPTLMDLPETDGALNDVVFVRAQQARTIWQEWAELYMELFGGLDTESLDEENRPTAQAQALFRGIRIPQPPKGAFPTLEALPLADQQTARKLLGVSPAVALPQSGSTFFSELIDRRQVQATNTSSALPRPYAQGSPSRPDGFVEDAATDIADINDGLYRQRAKLLEQISLLQAELDANDRLVSDFDVFIRAQRQQIDSITVSFTALAGGVPGDGSGLQLAKWIPFTQLEASAPSDDE